MTTVAHHRAAPDGGPSRDQEVLEERARALARPLARGEDHAAELVLLEFTVTGRAYAIEVAHVLEILARAELSRLPSASPAIVGVTSVRGEIVAVADMARLLGVGVMSTAGPVIVLDGRGHPIGLRVDAVQDVRSAAVEAFAGPGGVPGRPVGDFVVGMAGSTVVLDARSLSTDPRLTNPQQERT